MATREPLTRPSGPSSLSQAVTAETVGPLDPSVRLAPIQRVVVFAESFLPKIDGVSRTALLIIRHLQNTGREVLVFAPDKAPLSFGPS